MKIKKSLIFRIFIAFALLLRMVLPATLNAGLDSWTSNGPAGGPINSTTVDPNLANPYLYAGTDTGVYSISLNGGGWTRLTTDNLPTSQIQLVYFCQTCTLPLYALTSTQQLYNYDSSASTWLPASPDLTPPPGANFTSLYIDIATGIGFAGSPNGLYWINPPTTPNWTLLTASPLNISSLSMDEINKILFIATSDSGIYTLDTNVQPFDYKGPSLNGVDDHLTSVTFNSFDQRVYTSSATGLVFSSDAIPGSLVWNPVVSTGLLSNNVHSLSVLLNRLYAATDLGLAYTNTITQPGWSPIIKNIATNFTTDTSGNLYVGTRSNVNGNTYVKDTNTPASNWLPVGNPNVFQDSLDILFDNQNNYLYSASHPFLFEEQGLLHGFDFGTSSWDKKDDFLPDFGKLLAQNDHNLYVAAESVGVYQVDTTNISAFTHVLLPTATDNPNPGLSDITSFRFYDLVSDPLNKRVYLGTSNGTYAYDMDGSIPYWQLIGSDFTKAYTSLSLDISHNFLFSTVPNETVYGLNLTLPLSPWFPVGTPSLSGINPTVVYYNPFSATLFTAVHPGASLSNQVFAANLSLASPGATQWIQIDAAFPMLDQLPNEDVLALARDGSGIIYAGMSGSGVYELQTCGNNIAQPGEQCDGTDIPTSCVALGYPGGGIISCDPNCTLDLRLCAQNACGNGVLDNQDGNEQCDISAPGGTAACQGANNKCIPPDPNNPQQCTCQPSCGDGVTDGALGEQCDDGNQINNDGCTNTCQNAACGDGIVGNTPGEQCDDGNTDNTDACLNTCQAAICGDGVAQVGVEECDNGTNPVFGNGGTQSDCDVNCQYTCGNGVVDPNEECDPNDAASVATCTASGGTCVSGPSTDENACKCVPLPVCGNGAVEAGEQCDDGNTVNNDACTNTCTNAACGDTIVGPGETCDDGNTNNGDGCSATCQTEGGSNPVCGNGAVEAGEQCDDGNTISADGCSNLCVIEFCGDGLPGPAELCDDGNQNDFDSCTNGCVPPTPSCGNAILESGEDCDVGTGNGTDTCPITNPGTSCAPLGVAEECHCVPNTPVCGNGSVEAGEQCDDGNIIAGDGCSVTCQTEGSSNPVCGNGTQEIGETCDDGNQVNGDGCSSLCTFEGTNPNAVCGNGTQEQGEACDDGNTIVGDGCSDVCTLETDSNQNPICGNGSIETGESCDDGNTIPNDGCSATCQTETPSPATNSDTSLLLEGSGLHCNVVMTDVVSSAGMGMQAGMLLTSMAGLALLRRRRSR